MPEIRVHKLDAQGQHVLSYSGILIERAETWICIRAVFNHDDAVIGEITLRRGDLMQEWFYSDRYYNVFRIQSGEDHHIKGWYCNITRPAHISADEVAADDLALDIVIDPYGKITILDEDEFDALNLPDEEKSAAWEAIAEIKSLVSQRIPPFDI